MPKHNDGLSAPSKMVKELKKKMTMSEKREFDVLDRTTSRMWRNFWIGVARGQGYSYVEIAQEFDITESTVRNILQ